MDQTGVTPPAALADLAFPPFRPRAPWWGGDLQTMSNYLRRPKFSFDAYPQERLILPLDDGSGDRIAATLNRPVARDGRRPLAVLIHGLSGDEQSVYMQRSALSLLAQAYPVLRLNLRGAGPSRPLCRQQYHGGRTDDLAMALAALPPELTAAGIVVVGYSLGGNMLLKFVGERGAASPVRAAVSVSAPIDLAATSDNMQRWRNSAYQGFLLKQMRDEAVAPISELSADLRRAVLAARSIWDFDECFTVPRNGFAGAADYYTRNSAMPFLAGIAVPTLVMHALDDPWVPAASYLDYDWASNRHLVPLLSRRGGHVGFHGADDALPWHDAAIARFFAAVSPT